MLAFLFLFFFSIQFKVCNPVLLFVVLCSCQFVVHSSFLTEDHNSSDVALQMISTLIKNFAVIVASGKVEAVPQKSHLLKE